MFTIDGHSDTMLRVMNEADFDFFAHNHDGHLDLPRLKAGGVNLQIMALFIESQYKPHQALARTFEMCGAFHRLLRQGKDKLTFVKSKEDLTYIEKNKEIVGLLMALEGGEAVTSIDMLESLFALGLRLITLTWNQRNLLADGVGEKETRGGLTQLGKEVVGKMNELGMVVDVSHLSEAGFWDVVEHCRGPFVASHSNAYGLTAHQRNLTDKQITALVEKGGVIGINFAPSFLNESGQASIEDVLLHIDYIVNGWGFDSLGLGSDYDGISHTPTGLEDASTLLQLQKKLLGRYPAREVEKIMGGNWQRVLMDILPEANK